MAAIHTVVSGKWRENCYILHAESESIVIDPGEDTDTIVAFLDAHGLRVQAILGTHAHYDHVGSVAELQARDGAAFHLHEADRKLLRQANLYRKLFGGTRTISIPDIDADLAACPRLRLGGFGVEVIHTPGHTPGSVSFLVGESLFVGDTMFAKRIGRTDMPGGDQRALAASIRHLLGLAPTLTLYPGHGAPVAMADVFETNRDLMELVR